MNPHFVYNALNSIQALVGTNRSNEAIEYIGRFARLLRQVLEQSDNHVITLEKEIQTLEHYMSLEMLRMDLKPKIDIQFQTGLNASAVNIPPLILQPFVENALWHGLVKKEGEKILQIKFEINGKGWLTCAITDNGIGRHAASQIQNQNKTHESKGIAICTRRLVDFNGTDQPFPIEYTDLYNGEMNPTGTTVNLFIRV
jgi:LytS/YehU family sensor histidine kinase